MKIVDRWTFLAMPAGTVFQKYVPCCFEGLAIKGDSLGFNDFVALWVTESIESTGEGDYGDQLQLAEETGSSVSPNFNGWGRDGCFDDEQLFAVWEAEDINKLISVLQESLTSAALEKQV